MASTITSTQPKLKPGRIYGLGDVRSKLVPHETIDDAEIGEICIRRLNSSEPFTRVDEFRFPTHCVELNRDLTEVGDDSDDLSIEAFIDHCEGKILLHRGELQSLEFSLCDRLGCSVGDGSELADAIFNFVHNTGPGSQKLVLEAFSHAALERDEDPIEV